MLPAEGLLSEAMAIQVAGDNEGLPTRKKLEAFQQAIRNALYRDIFLSV